MNREATARAGVPSRRWSYAALGAGVTVVVGLLGAGAFNPDDGFLLRSEGLWRAFGIAAYAGMGAGYLIVLVAAGRLALGLVRRARRAYRSGA